MGFEEVFEIMILVLEPFRLTGKGQLVFGNLSETDEKISHGRGAMTTKS